MTMYLSQKSIFPTTHKLWSRKYHRWYPAKICSELASRNLGGGRTPANSADAHASRDPKGEERRASASSPVMPTAHSAETYAQMSRLAALIVMTETENGSAGGEAGQTGTAAAAAAERSAAPLFGEPGFATPSTMKNLRRILTNKNADSKTNGLDDEFKVFREFLEGADARLKDVFFPQHLAGVANRSTFAELLSSLCKLQSAQLREHGVLALQKRWEWDFLTISTGTWTKTNGKEVQAKRADIAALSLSYTCRVLYGFKSRVSCCPILWNPLPLLPLCAQPLCSLSLINQTCAPNVRPSVHAGGCHIPPPRGP